MSLSFGLELRQEQKQVMSQRMIQSMEILQLSTQQLEERIDQELLDNPVLEQTEPHSGPEEQSEFERDPELPFDAKEDGTRGVDSQEHFQIAADFAQNYADTIDELPSRSQNWLERESERRDDLLANLSLSTETLQDHLTSQLAWFDFSPDVRELMDHIINNLDPSGYFSLELHDIFPSESTAANLALAEEALKAVQRLDPPGVAARNLAGHDSGGKGKV